MKWKNIPADPGPARAGQFARRLAVVELAELPSQRRHGVPRGPVRGRPGMTIAVSGPEGPETPQKGFGQPGANRNGQAHCIAPRVTRNKDKRSLPGLDFCVSRSDLRLEPQVR